MSLDSLSLNYHRQLMSSTEGLDWHRNRGLTEDTIKRFRLGWITEPLSPSTEHLSGNPVIPYLTLSGRVVELRVRKLTGKPKYLRVEHWFPIPLRHKAHLFNARHAIPTPRSPEVYVVEGEYDCMIAVQCGLRAIAVPGATNWNPVWTNLLSSSRIAVAFDGDPGGDSGTALLERQFAERRLDYRVVQLPEGEDITDLYLRGGSSLVRDSLSGLASEVV